MRGEGKSPRQLEAGEAASIARDGRITPVAQTDPNAAVAWRQRRLVLYNSTLADVAMQFNRYNRTPRIVVEGERANGRQLTDVFDADAPESSVRFLSDAEELSVVRGGGDVIIRAR